ncbi:MFS general substrate transporter [Annulohypoxylon maeteangense]|uniref:MFS general substrate transporter n=1 Tax=Annulohypoxylon maeteangense TaxID=1927788 RepID=UPI0020081F05|nr:MFS general substrate transporter [Annulohypoxylon maeteangense]KAI0885713.1 MFS general substrate transporter [Annulohypoxylon maeteangense]
MTSARVESSGGSPFKNGSREESGDSKDAPSINDSTTEETPLLRSGSGSDVVGSVSSVSSDPSEDGDSPDLDTPNQRVSRGRAVAIILSVYLLIFLQATNMSGITMAQSTIAADLDSYENAMWFTTAFLVAMSSSTPLVGKLASIFSPRSMVLVASSLFAVGCFVTSQARSFSVFILGRVLTGMGGGAAMALAIVLILELTTKRDRGLYVGLMNAGFTTGVSLGAVVFGGLISVTGWRALFWAQVPLSLIAGLAIYFSIPASFSSGHHSKEGSLASKLKRIDYPGALFLTSTVVLFLFGLSNNIQPIPLFISLVTLVIFVLIECYVAADPIVPISVIKNRGALLICLSQLGFMAARWAVLFYAPIAALAVRGFAPATSGSILIPTNLGFGSGGLLVGWLHIRRAGSFWLSCVVSFTLFAASLFMLSLASTPDVPIAVYIVIVFFNGLFTGAALNYTLAHLLHLTAPETHYIATSLLGTFRGFAGSFGSAIGGGIFARTLRESLEKGFDGIDGSDRDHSELVRKLIGSPALVFNGGLGPREHEVAVQGYVDAIRVLFQAAVVLSVIVLVIQAGTGWKGPADKVKDSEEVGDGGVQSDGASGDRR